MIDKHVQVVFKQRNVGVQLQVPGTFWQGGTKEERRKLHRCTITEWSPNYEWRGRSSSEAFLFTVKGDSTTYAMSEFQYKEYAGEKAGFIPIDQHRQEQAPQNDTETRLPAVQQVAGDDNKEEPTRSKSNVYEHLRPTGELSSYRCKLCQAKVKQTGNSTSPLLSHLRRYDYNVYVELSIQYSYSRGIGVNGEGHVLTRMPFRAAFAHHYRTTKYLTRSLRPHATMLRDPDFRAWISGLCGTDTVPSQRTVEKVAHIMRALGFNKSAVCQTGTALGFTIHFIADGLRFEV